MENIWGADFADMQLVSKFNKGFRFMCYWHLQQIFMGYFFKRWKRNYNYKCFSKHFKWIKPQTKQNMAR